MSKVLNSFAINAPGFYGVNLQDSSVDLNPAFALEAFNCVFDQYGRLGARKGWETVATVAALSTADVETIGELIDNSGNSYIICAGNNKLFKLGSGVLVELTYGGGGVAPTITSNNWQIDTLNGVLYLFQRGFDPLIFDPAVSTTEYRRVSEKTGYTGTVLLANCVISAYGRLWTADVTGDKNTIKWSDNSAGHLWTAGTSGSLDVKTVWPNGADEIVALAAHNGFLIIFGKRQIIIYSGAETPSTMALQDTIISIGCIARDSVQSTGTDLIFLSGSGLRSLQRTIQEKSNPLRDLSRNVRDHFLADILTETAADIKSVYHDLNGFYLITLPNTGEVYCFDTKNPLEDGSSRVTIWNGISPKSLFSSRDKTLYLGQAGYLAKYATYLDNASTYVMRYYTTHMALNGNSLSTILKKLSLIVIGGSEQIITFKSAFDFSTNYDINTITTPVLPIAEWGIDEWGIAEFAGGIALANLPIQVGGAGNVVQFGIEIIVNGAAISIQKVSIYSKTGKTI
jgi:hypothetical protein